MKRPWTLIPVLTVYFGIGYWVVRGAAVFRDWTHLYVTGYILVFWGGWFGWSLSKRMYRKINNYLDRKAEKKDHDGAGADPPEA